MNLASRPVRNRRLFYMLMTALVIFLILVVYSTGSLFFEYRRKTEDLNTLRANLQQKFRAARREERRLSAAVQSMTTKYKGKVDLINSIILKKCFSWIDFFAYLENSLPYSSYIISLAPKLMGNSTMEVKFKVASRDLDELLKLINKLKALKFSRVRVESETKDERGLLLSEISLTYERSI